MAAGKVPASCWQSPLQSGMFQPGFGIAFHCCLSRTRVCSVGLNTDGRQLVHDTMEPDTGCVGKCNGFKEAPSGCGATLLVLEHKTTSGTFRMTICHPASNTQCRNTSSLCLDCSTLCRLF